MYAGIEIISIPVLVRARCDAHPNHFVYTSGCNAHSSVYCEPAFRVLALTTITLCKNEQHAGWCYIIPNDPLIPTAKLYKTRSVFQNGGNVHSSIHALDHNRVFLNIRI